MIPVILLSGRNNENELTVSSQWLTESWTTNENQQLEYVFKDGFRSQIPPQERVKCLSKKPRSHIRGKIFLLIN